MNQLVELATELEVAIERVVADGWSTAAGVEIMQSAERVGESLATTATAELQGRALELYNLMACFIDAPPTAQRLKHVLLAARTLVEQLKTPPVGIVDLSLLPEQPAHWCFVASGADHALCAALEPTLTQLGFGFLWCDQLDAVPPTSIVLLSLSVLINQPLSLPTDATLLGLMAPEADLTTQLAAFRAGADLLLETPLEQKTVLDFLFICH